jgi:hypothetical protein
MPPEEARRTADDFDVATAWLAGLVDPRSGREIRMAHHVRLALAALVAATLIAMLVQWVATPKNIALRKPVTASSEAWDTKPEGAVDGDKFTRFGFHSSLDDKPWLVIDLGANYRLTRVKVYGRGDCCFDQSVPLTMETSTDGTSFKAIAERASDFSQSAPWVVYPQSSTARFLRLRTQRTSYLVLSEVEVNGHVAK